MKAFSALLTLFLFAVLALPVSAQAVESWAELPGWTPQTGAEKCSTVSAGVLDMKCQSAAWVSDRTWDQTKPFSVSVPVRAQALAGGIYWGGVGVQNPTVEAALTKGYYWPAFLGDVFQNLGDKYVMDHVSPYTWYTLTLSYDPPSGNWSIGDGRTMLLNRTAYTYNQPMSSPLSVWLICVSVHEGTPDNGSSAECQFGQVTINGTLL